MSERQGGTVHACEFKGSTGLDAREWMTTIKTIGEAYAVERTVLHACRGGLLVSVKPLMAQAPPLQ
ncbi:MAG: hypothetical protein JNK06_13040 [Candidatus Accumulibacter phosphatis]|uniref:hypothetical protein n=1 Tax=Candidatus Accumulibacter phosphatis TaxID=327160 RepID=UPI001A56F27B|nr:hypothetical protein [Candidatus Accumulibacter phosphatis]